MNAPDLTSRPKFGLKCRDFADREQELTVRAWRGVVTLQFPAGESAAFDSVTQLENALFVAGMWSEVTTGE